MFLTYECYTVCSAVLKTNFLKPMGMLAATNNCCHSGSVMQVDVLHKVTFSCSSTNTLPISAQPTCPCPSPNIQKPMDWFIFNDGDTVSSYFLQTGQVSTGHQATSEYGANARPVPSMSHDLPTKGLKVSQRLHARIIKHMWYALQVLPSHTHSMTS